MAATGYTPILIYASGTAAAVPLAADLTTNATTGAELAINYTDGKLYYKNNSGVVTLLASTSGASGDVVGPASATDNALARFDLTTGKLIQNSVGILSDAGILTGLTGLTSSGPITLSSLTSGRVTFAGASGLLSDSSTFVFNGTSLGVGTSSPDAILDVTRSGNGQIAVLQTTGSRGFSFDSQSDTALQIASIQGSTNMDLWANTLSFSAGATERMRITSAGNVGIGTSSPSQLLHLNVSSGNVYEQISSGANNVYVGFDSSRTVGTIQSNNALTFDVGSSYTERMRIDTSGNVSVGGFAPSAWRTTDRVFEIGSVGKGLSAPTSGNSVFLATNWYVNTTPANVYAANGLATRYAQSDGFHTWSTAANNTSGAGAALTFTQAMTLNDSGNLSLSITPSAFGSTYKAFQAGGYAAYVGDNNNGYAEILNNAYASNNNIFNYYDTNSAGRYSIQLGAHKWFNTGSGSANAQITWTQAMTLDASGRLGIGTSSPSQPLTVNGVIASIGPATALSASSIFMDYNTTSNSGRFAAVGNTTGTAAPIYFSQYSSNASVGRDAVIIDSSGNLLVGTTTPVFNSAGRGLITINGSSAAAVGFTASGVDKGIILHTGTDMIMSNSVAGAITFQTTNSERMRIDSSGNVLIGTTTNTAFVNGTTQAVYGGIFSKANSSTAFDSVIGQLAIDNMSTTANNYSQLAFTTTDGANRVVTAAIYAQITARSSANWTTSNLQFYTGTVGNPPTEKMRIDSSGNVGIGTTSPSSYATGLTVAKSTTNGGDIALVKENSGTADQGGQAIRFYNYGPAQTGRSANVNLGSIYWLASQPTSGVAQDAALIECYSESQNGGQTPSQLAFWTASTGGLTKAMTIDSQQRLGIGTTVQSSFTTFPSKLVVGSGTGNQQITVYSGTASEGNIIFADGTTGTEQYRGVMRYDHADDAMKFYVNGGNLGLMINSAQDVLIGTSNNTTNGGFIFSPTYNGTGISAAIIGHSSAGGNGNQYMIFNYNGTGIGSIAQSGTTAVLYNTTSDQRLKTNVVDAPSGNIDEIKVRSFDWVADGSHQEYGMVAQELLEVAPYAVCNPTNPDEMMGVDYSKLVPMMIKEIQDLKAEVNQLKAKIGV